MANVQQGDGWSAATLDDLGEGPGFRKVRAELGVEAFGVNAIVIPDGFTSRRHKHERQEELYFVHAGTVEFQFGDGTNLRLDAGGFVRVAADTVRAMHVPSGSGDAIYICVGGEGGYVGRDGVSVEESEAS